MKLQSLTKNRIVGLLKETGADWMEDGALRLSAALAYYSIFSIAPLLIIAISIAGLVFGEEAVRGQLDDQLQSYIGPGAAEAVQSMVQSASKPAQGWIGAITGFFVLLLGASGVFGQLKDALNTIWEVKPVPGGGWKKFLRTRLLNFGMVLGIGFLLLTSLLLTTALAAFNGYLDRMLDVPAFVWSIISFVLSAGVVTLLFAMIFKVLPDAKIEWRNVWIGAAVTALLFELGKFGLGLYLGRESTASSFGAAGSVVLLLLWVYYTSCILFFGAEFTQVYARATGHVIEPAPGAVTVTAEARAQQGLTPASQSDEPSAITPEVRVIEIPAHAPGGALQPIGSLIAVTAASFAFGLLARRWTEEAQKPTTHLRKGLAGLSEQAVDELAQWVRPVLARTTSRRS